MWVYGPWWCLLTKCFNVMVIVLMRRMGAYMGHQTSHHCFSVLDDTQFLRLWNLSSKNNERWVEVAIASILWPPHNITDIFRDQVVEPKFGYLNTYFGRYIFIILQPPTSFTNIGVNKMNNFWCIKRCSVFNQLFRKNVGLSIVQYGLLWHCIIMANYNKTAKHKLHNVPYESHQRHCLKYIKHT
jgi:hypothetical protein